MKEELEKQLIEKYPGLFGDVNKSPKESLMCFGCEHGDGWYDIIDNLCGYITHLQKNVSYYLSPKEEVKDDTSFDGLFHCPNVVFSQIKEKYGTLRVYWNFREIENYDEIKSKLKNPDDLDEYIKRYDNMVENAIDFCEYLSSQTCEVTGKPGKLYSKGWCVTLCKEEAIKRFGFEPDEEDDNEE
tara:strand:+ start:153 stop:707 length:555 start_codon:yes stop_codon:yes gene_type:complete